MNKRGDKIISVYWFVILFIVTGAIVYMATLFYGVPYDATEIEERILTNQIADCIAKGGKLRSDVFSQDFRDNFLEICNIDLIVENEFGWEDNQHYIEVDFYEFDEKTLDGFGNNIEGSIIKYGNPNLKLISGLKSEKKELFFSIGGEREVDRIVIHDTEGETAEGALSTLEKRGLSVHYLIDKDGKVYKGVEEKKQAQHAGGEYNKRSIGIELVNLGPFCEAKGCNDYVELEDEFCRGEQYAKWERYPDEQINSLIILASGIISRNDGLEADTEHIIGHEVIDPEGKCDPGPAFPLDNFIEGVQKRLEINPDIGRTFYALNSEGKQYLVNVFSVVRKTEKNIQ